PVILSLLEDGSMNVTSVGLVAPHLTEANHRAVLDAARHRSKREVENQVAALRPQPGIPSSVRKLSAARASADVPPPTIETRTVDVWPSCPVSQPFNRPIVAPLAPERYRVQFTVSRETYDKLRRVQDLLRHTIPNGDPAAIFDRALTVLLAQVEKSKLATT